jgi:exopolysaccharide biosynthesis WecB/TagA/CpsF family protein
MKILIIHNEYQQRGGEDAVVCAEARMLQAAGHTTVEYHASNRDIAVESLVQKTKLAANTIWSFESARRIKELIAKERPDVAHFHNTFPLISPSAYLACRELGVPVVQTIHNYRLICPAGVLYRDGRACEECIGKATSWPGIAHGCYRESRAQTSIVAAMKLLHSELGTWHEAVNAYVTPSRFVRDKLIQGGLPAKKILVKPHFVSPDPGSHVTNDGYAAFAGRLSEEKGLRTLLKAWALARPKIPLRIIGDGPLRRDLESESERLRLENIHFAGEFSHSETIEAIQRALFLVAPSECYETFSMAAAEAAACGVPAIASRHGALAEIVQDRQTGLLFKPSDEQDLAATLDWAFEHAGQLEEMGRAARAKYEAQFTAERNLPRLLSIYERAGVRSASSPADSHAGAKINLKAEGLEPHVASESFSVLGVRVNVTQIPEVISQMEQWIAERGPCRMIAVTGMHGVMEAQHDTGFREVLASADAVVPDGMPIVWLGRLRGFRLRRRVYGPELMQTFCESTAAKAYRHFLYGGTPGQAEKLAEILRKKYPGLEIAGTHSPPFRSLTTEEDSQIKAAINEAAPDVVWVGLGTPKQEKWMHEHRAGLRAAILVGVGAAFDIHAGTKSQAPSWMREHGFEWLYRLFQEPRRLWKRYLVYGSEFVIRAGLELIGAGKKAHAR